MNEQLKALLDMIAQGTVLPCYLLHGDEPYLVRDAADRIIERLLPEGRSDFNFIRIDGENEDVDTIVEMLLTASLIPGRKVVFLRDTRLFHSKSSAAAVIGDIVDNLDKDPPRSARAFLLLLATAGWSLDDVRNDGWKKIPERQWRETFQDEKAAERASWVPRVIALCESLGLGDYRARKDTDRLEEALRGGIPKSHCLVVTAGTVDKRKKLYKIIAEKGAVLDFPKVKSEANQKTMLRGTAEELLAKHGKTITGDAFLLLGRKTGFAFHDAVRELEKLIDYTGSDSTIRKEDVEQLVGRTREDSIFDLTDAIAHRDAETALVTIRRLFDQGLHHLMILTMIIRQIRFLLQGKVMLGSEIRDRFRPGMHYAQFQRDVYPRIKASRDAWGEGGAWLAGQHPFVIFNVLANSERFPLAELTRFMEELIELDVALKSTGVDPQQALERAVMEMCRKPKRTRG